VNAGGAYALPVTRLSFQQARRKFLGFICRKTRKQQKMLDNDVNMLVPDGEMLFCLLCFKKTRCCGAWYVL